MNETEALTFRASWAPLGLLWPGRAVYRRRRFCSNYLSAALKVSRHAGRQHQLPVVEVLPDRESHYLAGVSKRFPRIPTELLEIDHLRDVKILISHPSDPTERVYRFWRQQAVRL